MRMLMLRMKLWWGFCIVGNDDDNDADDENDNFDAEYDAENEDKFLLEGYS